jgi:molybdenum cofactor biosynthesis enzyme MoaA
VNEAKLAVFPGSLEYRFCTPGWRGHQPAPLEQLLAQARAIDAGRCQRLVLAGDTPTAHPDFVALAKACRRLGFERMALETDSAALARRGMTTLLARLGFSQIAVVLAGLHEAVHDAVLQQPGTLRAALEGFARAVAAAATDGPSVYLVLPLLRANADDLEPLLDWAIGVPGKLQGVLLSLPEMERVPAEHRHEILPAATQAQIAARLFRICRRRKIEYGFTSKRGIIPCAATDALEQFATVYFDRIQYFQHTPHAREGAAFARIDACGACSLSDSCAGVEQAYLEQFGAAEFAPVPLDVSMQWKLRRINKLEQFEYRNVSPFTNESPVNPRGLLRVNGHCNMSCAFCFVDRTVPDIALEELGNDVRAMARGGTRHLVLSGGEPTLHPQLADLIRLAASLGSFDTIEMQSNGVRCADLEYARTLVDAGLNKITVSLHSIDPEHSDRITRLPKAFAKTVQAMHAFRQLGVLTQVAHVITKANYKELPDTVRFLRTEFPAEGGHLSICFAIAQGISDLVFQWVIPTFSEIKPYVKEALDFCLETGVGFGGMIGQGGYPPCMLDGDLRYYRNKLDKVFKSDDAESQFYKPEKCRACSFDAYCLGPRRSYVEHYGDAEITPFRAEIPRWRKASPAGRRPIRRRRRSPRWRQASRRGRWLTCRDHRRRERAAYAATHRHGARRRPLHPALRGVRLHGTGLDPRTDHPRARRRRVAAPRARRDGGQPIGRRPRRPGAPAGIRRNRLAQQRDRVPGSRRAPRRWRDSAPTPCRFPSSHNAPTCTIASPGATGRSATRWPVCATWRAPASGSRSKCRF